MDIKPTDRDFLLNSITTNSAVLFLGAGFSVGAKNKNGAPIPLAKDFTKILWEFLNYSTEYDGTNLQTVFESALRRKHSDIQRILDMNFRCSEIPEWYRFLSQIFWHRIYTTNIDDLVEGIFHKSTSGQNLQVFNAVTDDYRERDQFLESVQYIKLNGTLSNTPTSVTFSLTQYGERLVNTEVWYDQFFRDYATRPTVFIGSELDEPMFWQALAARGKRYPKGGRLEKSFLVEMKLVKF
jgi:hypothetical protein